MPEFKEGHNLQVWEITKAALLDIAPEEQTGDPPVKILQYALKFEGKDFAVVVSGDKDTTAHDFLGALATCTYSLAGKLGAELVGSRSADSHEQADKLLAEMQAEIDSKGKALN
jgi:hypothetical protein